MQHDTFVLSVLSHTGNYAHGKFKILQSSIVLNVILYIETGLSEKKSATNYIFEFSGHILLLWVEAMFEYCKC